MNVESVAEKHGITPAQVRQLKKAMQITWDVIAHDWFGACVGGGGEYESTEEMVAEATLDANRIVQYSGENVDWVYKKEDGTRRKNLMGLGQDVWRAS